MSSHAVNSERGQSCTWNGDATLNPIPMTFSTVTEHREKAKEFLKNLAIQVLDDTYEWYVYENRGVGGIWAQLFLAPPHIINPILPKLTDTSGFSTQRTISASDVSALQNLCSVQREQGGLLKDGVTLETLHLEHMEEPPKRRWKWWRFYGDPLETEKSIEEFCGVAWRQGG